MTNALNTKSAHTSSPVSELVERLRSTVGYSPYIGYALVAEAADSLTALEAENARLRAIAVGSEDPDEPSSYRQLSICLLMDFERYAEDETSARRMVSVNGYKEDLERIDAKAALTAPQGGDHGE